MTSHRRRIAAAACAAALAGLFGAGGGVAALLPRPAAILAERAGVTAAGYWTRARMAAALAGRQPSAGDPWDSGTGWAGGGAVSRTTGRVFFTLDGTGYSCSGSVVASANADVVITAAHCVSDGHGGWATHWIFVPGYSDGRAPYGRYPARRFFVAGPWQHGADEADDVAFVAVGTGGASQHVADAVGGQQIEFGYRGAVQTVFGYPSEPPYHGRYLDYCDGPLSPDPYGSADAGIDCTMTEGASGGPWFSGFDPRTGLGTITGVSTFRYSGDSLTLYSADLGSVAQGLYDQASRSLALF